MYYGLGQYEGTIDEVLEKYMRKEPSWISKRVSSLFG
jgi:hypothetical protein